MFGLDLDPKLMTEYFSYNQKTGDLIWKVAFQKFMKVGKVAGHRHASGIVVGINKKVIPARRIVWAYHYGEWPDGNVKHKDKDKFNNRIENLEVNGCTRKIKARIKVRKEIYTDYKQIPISEVNKFFKLDCKNIPFWKERASPKVDMSKPAGRRYGNAVYIGFKGLILDARIITYALLNGEWPKD